MRDCVPTIGRPESPGIAVPDDAVNVRPGSDEKREQIYPDPVECPFDGARSPHPSWLTFVIPSCLRTDPGTE